MYLLEVTAADIQIAGTFMFFIAIAWLLAEFKGMKDEMRERLGINNETIKLRLQAYERLTLYTERSALKNLVSRLHAENMNARELQIALIQTLNSEYEYNVTQQIYIDPKLWQAIGNLKDQNTYIINQIAAMLPSDADGIELSKRILEYSSNNDADLSGIVLNALQYEAKTLL